MWCKETVFVLDLTTLELLRRDVKVANSGTFSIAVSAIITEMQVWCSWFTDKYVKVCLHCYKLGKDDYSGSNTVQPANIFWQYISSFSVNISQHWADADIRSCVIAVFRQCLRLITMSTCISSIMYHIAVIFGCKELVIICCDNLVMCAEHWQKFMHKII